MKHFLRICTACAAVAAASTLPAVEVILDGCRSTAGWNSFNGSEFKGAKVSLSGGADGLKLGYDFAAAASTSAATRRSWRSRRRIRCRSQSTPPVRSDSITG